MCFHVGDTIGGGSDNFESTKEIIISQTEFAAKITVIPMSTARKKMREDLADKAEIHAFRGVGVSVGWIVRLVRMSHAKFPNCNKPSKANGFSSLHSDLGLKIRRVSIQNMMLLLHVDASLNTGGLVGAQGGYNSGVTSRSLLEGKSAPWIPLARRSFKMSRTVPSLLGAEAQAMSAALRFVEWATLVLQELMNSPFHLRGARGVMRETDRQYVSRTARACTIICRLWEARQRCKTRDQPSMCSSFEST